MPELPEVEVLVRHLAPLIRGRRIRGVQILRAKVLHPTAPGPFKLQLQGATFLELTRRAKYLVFQLRSKKGKPFTLLGHLGMTGRMYLSPAKVSLPKHAAVVLNLGRDNFIYEDTRYFGRFNLDTRCLSALGPEPWDKSFTVEKFAGLLKRSSQPVKIKLLDQSLVAGLGNIYASEALFRARISPRVPANRLQRERVKQLRKAIRETLADAIKRGSTVPLNYGAAGERDGLFYFGRAPGAADYYEERLQVYDRAGEPCRECGKPIRRLVQGARSTFFCPHCQRE